MFWNSMWDNKINYTRSFKEDIFLSKFIDFFIKDGISLNTFNKKKINKKNIYKYSLPHKNISKSILTKLFFDNATNNVYTSKLWILKYQKWIILYCFCYSPKHNILKKTKFFKKKIVHYNTNLFNSYNLYLKISFKFNLSVNYFKSQNFKNTF